MKTMKYRILPPEEWARLDGIIPPEVLPAPESAAAAIAEDDAGRIVGVLFLQLQLHMEPLFLSSPEVNFRRLQQVLEEAVSDVAASGGLVYWAMTDNPNVARMAEITGMERVEMQLWRKVVH